MLFLTEQDKGANKMITFYGELALATLAVYALACWLISKIPSPKRTSGKVASVTDTLADGNREKSESKFYGWH